MVCNNGQSLTLPRLNVMKLLMRALTKNQMEKSQNTNSLLLNCFLQHVPRWANIFFFFAIKNVADVFFSHLGLNEGDTIKSCLIESETQNL
jgi:hypothetical protein